MNRPAFRADPTDEIRSFSRRGVGWEPAFNPFFLKAEPRGLPFAANFSFPRCHRPEPTLTNVTISAPCMGKLWCICRCARAWARFSLRSKRDSLDRLTAM